MKLTGTVKVKIETSEDVQYCNMGECDFYQGVCRCGLFSEILPQNARGVLRCTQCIKTFGGEQDVKTQSCFSANNAGKCLGLACEPDDEPIKRCKMCKNYEGYGVE